MSEAVSAGWVVIIAVAPTSDDAHLVMGWVTKWRDSVLFVCQPGTSRVCACERSNDGDSSSSSSSGGAACMPPRHRMWTCTIVVSRFASFALLFHPEM